MSQSSWLVAGMLPGIERQPRKKLEPSAERLLGLLRDPGTKRLIASARQGAVGVIYLDLLWLMRFNSHPINADRYLIGRCGLSGSLERGFADARCCLQRSYGRLPDAVSGAG